MMQSFWLSRQLWARLHYVMLCAYWQATWSVFCETELWNGKKKLAGIINLRSDQRHTLTRGHMPQVHYGKFWKKYGWQVIPPLAVQFCHDPTSLWLVPKIEEGAPWETLQKHWGCVLWGDASNQTHQQRRRPDRNTRLAPDVGPLW